MARSRVGGEASIGLVAKPPVLVNNVGRPLGFPTVRPIVGTRAVLACVLAVVAGGCGGSGHSGSSGAPLTLAAVRANLLKAGYKVTVYTPNEGVLQIDATHNADAGLSIDNSPDGQQVYAAVYEARDPAVRAVVISRNSDETPPVVRGDLIFTISGTAPELQRIVKDAGDAAPSTVEPQPASSADVAAVKASLRSFLDVYAAADSKAVCASLTPQALSKSQTFCNPRSIFYKRHPAPLLREYSITAVTVSGETATATLSFRGATEDLALRKLNGQWKIDTQPGAGDLI